MTPLLMALTLATSLDVQPPPTATAAAGAYRQGLALLAHEYWAEAADAFARAIDLEPRFTLAYYGLGRARMGQKAFPAAVTALTRCRELFLSDLGTRAADQLAASHRRQDQILQLREALRERQAGPQTSGNQTIVRQLQDQLWDLETLNRTSLELQLRPPAFVSLSLGSAHFRAGQLAEAEAAYLDALNANPKMGEAHNNLAVVYLLTGRVAEADKAVARAERHGYPVSPQFKRDLKLASPR